MGSDYLNGRIRSKPGPGMIGGKRGYLFGRWPTFLIEKGEQREVSLMGDSFKRGKHLQKKRNSLGNK